MARYDHLIVYSYTSSVHVIDCGFVSHVIIRMMQWVNTWHAKLQALWLDFLLRIIKTHCSNWTCLFYCKNICYFWAIENIEASSTLKQSDVAIYWWIQNWRWTIVPASQFTKFCDQMQFIHMCPISNWLAIICDAPGNCSEKPTITAELPSVIRICAASIKSHLPT